MNEKTHPKKSSVYSETEQEIFNLSYDIARYKDRVYLGPHYPTTYFTPREMDCARELLLGKTIKEIAKSLGISNRSVEVYLKNMRLKLAVDTKHELFHVIRDIIDFEK